MPPEDDRRPVVVGYDDSAESRRALRWAVEEARLRFLPLLLCHAWQWPYPMLSLTPDTTGVMRRMGLHVLETGMALAHALAPRVQTRARLVEGSPEAALVGLSGIAELIAIGPGGSGDSGGSGAPRIGSAAARVASRARCPVAVVGRPGPVRAGRVAIAVEEADLDAAELGIAFEEARLRGAALLVICLCPEGAEDIRRVAVRLNTDVALWEERYPRLEVETVIETRPHVEALRRAADRSDLLVVAEREHDDPSGLPAGRAYRTLLREAPCAIVVTPSRRRRASPRRNVSGVRPPVARHHQ